MTATSVEPWIWKIRVWHYHSPARTGECQKCQASANHRSLACLASTIFVAKKLLKLWNKHCVLHSILPRKHLSINRLFLFTKFYIPNCLINWHWKERLDFLNRQRHRWSGYRNMAPKDRSWDSQVAGISQRFIFKKIYLKCKTSASTMFPWGLRWSPRKRTHHRFPMKLGKLMLQDKEILKT